MKLRDKKLQTVMTAEFEQKYGSYVATYFPLAVKALTEYPDVNMLVFEMDDDDQYMKITYEDGEETKVFGKYQSISIKKFWFKLDDYGDKYVGTFLFPHEY